MNAPPDGPRRPPARVALETTLILHGVPRGTARELAERLARAVRDQGAEPALVGVVAGRAVVGMTLSDLDALLNADPLAVPKVNTANLGLALRNGGHAATTVSTTMELASGAGVSVFATGGIGGVHRAPAPGVRSFDVSADLAAFTRWPVAVVTSGVKSIHDIAATREVLETLGVPVVGFGTDEFPAFYMRRSPDQNVGRVDARFDDARELAKFVRAELARTNRGIVVCNPIPAAHELKPEDWARWLAQAEQRIGPTGAAGRDATPALLGALHEVSGGATLRANIALVESNARLAGQIARAMAD